MYNKTMENRNFTRAGSIAANILLVCTGSAVALAQAFTNTYKFSGNFITPGVLSIVMLFLSLVLSGIELFSVLKLKDSIPHTFICAAFLSLLMLFSPDLWLFVDYLGANVNKTAYEMGGEIAFAGLEISVLVFMARVYLPERQRQFTPAYIVLAACCVAYSALIATRWKHTAHLASVAVTVITFIYMRHIIFRRKGDDLTMYLTSAIMASGIGMHTVSAMYYSGLTGWAGGWTSGYFAVCFACFLAIYLGFILRNEREAKQASEYKFQAEQLKTRLLLEQIKPHFIFNALTTIKSMYHRGTAEGADALGVFSLYLRNSIDIIDEEMIPFERELENIARYIDFSNINQTNKFNVVYDIEESDFLIPAFSVQPFVENAVKYSRVNRREDGFIMISARAVGEGIVLEISDNGDGFDPLAVHGGHGMSNACERFRLLMGATPEIESAKGTGTKITVHIARKTGANG